MKKNLLTLLLIISSGIAFGQTFKEDPSFVKQAPNAKGYMVDTIAESKFTKQQLYSNAMAFLTNNFKDIRSVVESKDLDLGEISFKGSAITSVMKSDTTKKGKISTSKWKIPVYFKCKIYVKDQKFKIVLNSLDVGMMVGLSGAPLDPYSTGVFSQENIAASEAVLDLIKNIAVSINKKSESDF